MVLWSDMDTNLIDFVSLPKDRHKFEYKGGPLRFQIPRGVCTWGVSAYKSLQVTQGNPEFNAWWRGLETLLCPQEPFNSNLKLNELRIKIDDSVYIFDENSKQVTPEVREGLFKGCELSCLVDVDSTYFFNGTWGLTVKLAQVRFYGNLETPCDAQRSEDVPFLTKGTCAFLPS